MVLKHNIPNVEIKSCNLLSSSIRHYLAVLHVQSAHQLTLPVSFKCKLTDWLSQLCVVPWVAQCILGISYMFTLGVPDELATHSIKEYGQVGS